MKNTNKDTVWAMFMATGNPSYYSLYKRLSEDGSGRDMPKKP